NEGDIQYVRAPCSTYLRRVRLGGGAADDGSAGQGLGIAAPRCAPGSGPVVPCLELAGGADDGRRPCGERRREGNVQQGRFRPTAEPTAASRSFERPERRRPRRYRRRARSGRLGGDGRTCREGGPPLMEGALVDIELIDPS